MSEVVNLSEKLKLFADHWHPRIIAQVDMYFVKLARVKGEFVWHNHQDQDEMFLVVSGEMTIKMHEGNVHLNEGDLYVVPRGVEHCPEAAEEASILVLERVDTPHTGDVVSR
ncbi:MAG: cupin domain-containing protein, partial [Chloroflexota bacterium]